MSNEIPSDEDFQELYREENLRVAWAIVSAFAIPIALHFAFGDQGLIHGSIKLSQDIEKALFETDTYVASEIVKVFVELLVAFAGIRLFPTAFKRFMKKLRGSALSAEKQVNILQ